jgi:energy-coupling factor transporter ATP-binding protein EcfA2
MFKRVGIIDYAYDVELKIRVQEDVILELRARKIPSIEIEKRIIECMELYSINKEGK